MSLDRARRVAALWNWLPVFRTAAEYESLQKAGLVLSVSPSAISRTIKQLEDALGEPVFDRHPGGVKLTPRGERLLRATRDAMRLVDDGLEPPAQELRVGAVGPFLPALLARALDGAQPCTLLHVAASEVGPALLRGDADLVLSHAEDEDGTLGCELLGRLKLVAAGAQGASTRRVVSWPLGPTLPGAVTDRVEDLQAMLALAEHGRVVVLPELLRPPALALRGDLPTELPVYALTRRALVENGGAAPQATVQAALRELLAR